MFEVLLKVVFRNKKNTRVFRSIPMVSLEFFINIILLTTL